MKPYWTNGVSTLYRADAREIPLPDASVHCVVTSPPYWGLRDYGLGAWQGGDAECGHQREFAKAQTSTLTGGVGNANSGNAQGGWPNDTCGHCGATQQTAGIGLEPTLGEWVENVVSVMREVRRVLRDDGTVWLNLGDAYSANRSYQVTDNKHRNVGNNGAMKAPEGIPPKNLMGQPWRVAFALQDDGWILRSAIVWHKPNPMPESTKDRPTSAYEMVFLLTKQGRYFYDAAPLRTPGRAPTKMPDGWDTGSGAHGSYHRNGREEGRSTDKQRGHSRRHAGFNDRWDSMSKDEQQAGGANARNVWTIATQPRSEVHFAAFPDELPRRCILAGTSEHGVCGECGAPWARVVEHGELQPDDGKKKLRPVLTERSLNADANSAGAGHAKTGHVPNAHFESITLGWQPTCCDCEVLVRTPVGDGRTRLDPTLQTGRKGLNRERNPNGTRPMTRREQRDYARQIRESDNKEDIRRLAGDAFDHYIRTDQSGARPLPPDILATCIDRGWLKQSGSKCNCPCSGAEIVPATVLDPFVGSGTTVAVAQALGRRGVGLDLNPEYLDIAAKRVGGVTLPMALG